MKRVRRKGFVLILVIVLIGVFGLEMFVLGGGSNTILFQTNTVYLQAVERNLIESGLAWAKRNIREENKEILDKTTELDVTNMSIRDATLSIVISEPSVEEIQVQVSTSCSKSRQTLRSDDKYKMRL